MSCGFRRQHTFPPIRKGRECLFGRNAALTQVAVGKLDVQKQNISVEKEQAGRDDDKIRASVCSPG